MQTKYYQKIDGTKVLVAIKVDEEHFLISDSGKVPVTKAVFSAYMRPIWREAKREEVWFGRERSADEMAEAEDGYELPSSGPLTEEMVAERLLLAELYSALDELTEDERGLIDALYFDDQSERKLSEITGIPRKTISGRKERVLQKLRKKLSKG